MDSRVVPTLPANQTQEYGSLMERNKSSLRLNCNYMHASALECRSMREQPPQWIHTSSFGSGVLQHATGKCSQADWGGMDDESRELSCMLLPDRTEWMRERWYHDVEAEAEAAASKDFSMRDYRRLTILPSHECYGARQLFIPEVLSSISCDWGMVICQSPQNTIKHQR